MSEFIKYFFTFILETRNGVAAIFGNFDGSSSSHCYSTTWHVPNHEMDKICDHVCGAWTQEKNGPSLARKQHKEEPKRISHDTRVVIYLLVHHVHGYSIISTELPNQRPHHSITPQTQNEFLELSSHCLMQLLPRWPKRFLQQQVTAKLGFVWSQRLSFIPYLRSCSLCVCAREAKDCFFGHLFLQENCGPIGKVCRGDTSSWGACSGVCWWCISCQVWWQSWWSSLPVISSSVSS